MATRAGLSDCSTVMSARDKVFVFWDAWMPAVVFYCAQSVRHDKIPFYF